jgi:hypothetical protein
MYTKLWLENLKRRENSKHLDIDERIILKGILKKHDGKMWTRLIWLRIGSSGGLL